MDWNKIFTSIAYVAGAVAISIPTMGLALPVWVAPVLTGIATVSGKMAASHSNVINQATVAKSLGGKDS